LKPLLPPNWIDSRRLQLGAAHFQDVSELHRLGFERPALLRHGIDHLVDQEMQRHLDRRRIDVIGALAHVHVFVGVQMREFATAVAEQFVSPRLEEGFMRIRYAYMPRTSAAWPCVRYK
jgi:hypothetical protein